jgi:general secretion pathway protein G
LKALVEPPASLDRWAGPYVSEPSILNDPWGRPYVYHVPSRRRGAAYDLYTLGPDGDATGPPTASDTSQPAQGG